MKTIGILLLLFLWSCSNAQEKKAKTSPETKEKKTISYLALGDSYTIGESVTPKQRYPNQLAEVMRAKGFSVKKPLIIAQTGWTTADLQRGIQDAQIENQTYDLVSILIGVNNQYQGRSLKEYEKEYKSLLKQAIAFANNDTDKVFVLSIPDYGYTPFGTPNRKTISAEIDAFNASCKRITESMGVDFYNITDISRMAEKDKSLVAKDNLHPSGAMYNAWVKRITDKVLEKVN